MRGGSLHLGLEIHKYWRDVLVSLFTLKDPYVKGKAFNPELAWSTDTNKRFLGRAVDKMPVRAAGTYMLPGSGWLDNLLCLWGLFIWSDFCVWRYEWIPGMALIFNSIFNMDGPTTWSQAGGWGLDSALFVSLYRHLSTSDSDARPLKWKFYQLLLFVQNNILWSHCLKGK